MTGSGDIRTFVKLVFVLDSPGKGNMTDSETDSDVLFESRNKAAGRFNGDSLRNGATKSNRNGFIKLGRRVKT